MDKKLASIIDYFAIFDYFPTFTEVYTFFPEKISKKTLKTLFEAKKYTPLEYGMGRKISHLRQGYGGQAKIKISQKKLNSWRFKAYIKLLSLFPQIQLVGLSGSISMMNAEEKDDIDLFVITAKNRLFTGRLITLVLAQLLGLRRNRDSAKQFLSHESLSLAQEGGAPLESEKITFASSADYKGKVCLNLFFDESNLKVPVRKQTLFVGHEVLQMKPIINKDSVYERFLTENDWVFRLFPNAFHVIPAEAGIQTKSTGSPTRSGMTSHFFTFNFVESILKKFQLRLINRHKTTEIITSTQLWFHPDDFEKKIKI